MTLQLSTILHAHLLDAGDLGEQVGARQAIGGNAEMQHAAGHRTGLADLHLMAEAGEVVGGRQAARTGADDQDALAGGGGDRHRPALRGRHVAEEAFHRMDDTAASSSPRLQAVSQG